jgi:ketosteroid isomerase-like protein
MSKETIEVARRAYAALNDGYRTRDFLPGILEICDPEVVVKPSGMFPEQEELHGHEGMRGFLSRQSEAFEEMWIEPGEFIDAGERAMVPFRFGGRARHSGIETEFSLFHVWTVRNGLVVGLDMCRTEAEAREAAGLSS